MKRASLPLPLLLLSLLLGLSLPSQAAQSISLSWNSNAESDIAGYRVRYGTDDAPYTHVLDVKTTTATISDLADGSTYLFAVSAYNTAGAESPLSSSVTYTTPQAGATPKPTATPAPISPPGLVNISSRAFVQSGDNVMIGGFIITGNTSKKVAVRAIGPSLGTAGVTEAMIDPFLELLDANGKVVVSNDSWNAGNQEWQTLGLAPTDRRECGIITTLAAGSYSAVVSGKNSTSGVALVEVYDLDPTNGQLANISTRCRVETGDRVMIGGFILGGNEATKVIIRGIGPSLVASGVSDALLDPMLELYDSNGSLVASNDNWRATQPQAIINSTVPPTDDREAAIVSTLAPGAYSAVLRGANNSVGVALFEVYALNQ